MPASIGVNLRVTGHCRQGGRKYMEDFFSVAYQQTEDERDLEYAFFGIYDGHGGAEAAAFAKERLMETIVRHRNFWSDDDEDVLRAIKMGYVATHYAMWKEQENWPRTASGLPSTAGTTASVAFIRRGKIYVGHVGDSAIVLGYQEPGSAEWKARPLTRDHKPECANEMSRIQSCGGKVVAKCGVPRVVWNRPRIGHRGPVRRSTPIDEIPFLAVARSLGDLWSYNSELDAFVVSPDPDCSALPIDARRFRCLIFGTDGLFNMLSPQAAVDVVRAAERHNEEAALVINQDPLSSKPSWINPSKCLVEKALELWSNTKMRADNTSVVTLMLDPPGPPRAEVLRNLRKSASDGNSSGLQIVTRYPNNGDSSATPKPDEPPTSSSSTASLPASTPANPPKTEPADASDNPETTVLPSEQEQETPSSAEGEAKNRALGRPEEPPEPPNEAPPSQTQGYVGFRRVQHKVRTVVRQQQQPDGSEAAVGDGSRTGAGSVAEESFERISSGSVSSGGEEQRDSFGSDCSSEVTTLTPSPSEEESIQINEVSSSSNEIFEDETKTPPFRASRKRKLTSTSASEDALPRKRDRINLRVRKMSVLESVEKRSEKMNEAFGASAEGVPAKKILVDRNPKQKGCGTSAKKAAGGPGKARKPKEKENAKGRPPRARKTTGGKVLRRIGGRRRNDGRRLRSSQKKS